MLPSRRSFESLASLTLESSSQVLPSNFSSDEASSTRSHLQIHTPSPHASLKDIGLEASESPIDRFLIPSISIGTALGSPAHDLPKHRGRAHWSVVGIPVKRQLHVRSTSDLPSLPAPYPPPNQPLPLPPNRRISSLKRRSPTPPPPPARSQYRPLPDEFPRDPDEQLRQQVHRQRQSWIEHLAQVGLAQEHQRQLHWHEQRKGSASSRETLPPSLSTPDLAKHQRSPSAHDDSASLISISAYSGTSSTLQQATLARRPERADTRSKSADRVQYYRASKYNSRILRPKSALLNAVNLPERAADQNKQRRPERLAATRPAWPINHAPRESLENNYYETTVHELGTAEAVAVVRFVESPRLYHTTPTSSPKLKSSGEFSRPTTRHGSDGKESAFTPELVDSYFGRHSVERPDKGKDKMEKADPAPPSTARSNLTFSQASETDHRPTTSDTVNRAHTASVDPSHNDGSYLAASDLENGAGEQEAEEDEDSQWGPLHPCFPHLNPHVPINSPLHQSTRIIRIKRDYLLAGDLAPTYSNLYPEILDPWVTEEEFRNLVTGVNDKLVEAYNPFSIINILDILLALLTFWLWDDLGFTFMKRRLRDLESWLVNWNNHKAKDAANGGETGPNTGTTISTNLGKSDADGSELVKVYPLRSTAYLSIDIQIPDPKLPVFASAGGMNNGTGTIGSNVPPSSRPVTQDTARPIS